MKTRRDSRLTKKKVIGAVCTGIPLLTVLTLIFLADWLFGVILVSILAGMALFLFGIGMLMDEY